MNVISITRDGFNIWHSAMGHALILDFFGFHLYLARKYCKNPKEPWSPHNVNPAQARTWCVGVTIYRAFFDNNSPPPRRFLCNKLLLKKIRYSKGNAHWTKFSIERTWAPWPYMYFYNWLFSWQSNNVWEKFSSGLLFTAKILQEAMYFISPYPGQITYKI